MRFDVGIDGVIGDASEGGWLGGAEGPVEDFGGGGCRAGVARCGGGSDGREEGGKSSQDEGEETHERRNWRNWGIYEEIGKEGERESK